MMQLFFLVIIEIFFWFLAFLFQVIHVIFSGLWKLGKKKKHAVKTNGSTHYGEVDGVVSLRYPR